MSLQVGTVYPSSNLSWGQIIQIYSIRPLIRITTRLSNDPWINPEITKFTHDKESSRKIAIKADNLGDWDQATGVAKSCKCFPNRNM